MSPTVRKRTDSFFDGFARPGGRERRHRHDQAAAAHHRAAVRVVDGRHLELLARDVLPHVELGPVADREHAHVLAGVHARVVQAPQLGALVARVPLAELVAEREHALLGARLLLVAARAADGGVELEFGDRLEQGHRLRGVAAFDFPRRRRTVPRADGILHAAHDAGARPARRRARSRNAITSGKLWPVSMCSSGNGKLPGRNAFSARRSRHDRVLAAGEEQHRVLALRPPPRAGCRWPRTRASRGDALSEHCIDCASSQLSRRLTTIWSEYVQPAFLVLRLLPPPAAGAHVLAGQHRARVQGAQPIER